jgi:hypothetical protein
MSDERQALACSEAPRSHGYNEIDIGYTVVAGAIPA